MISESADVKATIGNTKQSTLSAAIQASTQGETKDKKGEYNKLLANLVKKGADLEAYYVLKSKIKIRSLILAAASNFCYMVKNVYQIFFIINFNSLFGIQRIIKIFAYILPYCIKLCFEDSRSSL